MKRIIKTQKFKEWLHRYALAELSGTIIALSCAWFTYSQTNSYLDATAAGFVGEGIGFYGYFILEELRRHGLRYKGMPLYKRLPLILAKSSSNLFAEFAPAAVIDSLFIRPFATYAVPHHIHPYGVGFLIGKFSADLIFYTIAIAGYEFKKHLKFLQ